MTAKDTTNKQDPVTELNEAISLYHDPSIPKQYRRAIKAYIDKANAEVIDREGERVRRLFDEMVGRDPLLTAKFEKELPKEMRRVEEITYEVLHQIFLASPYRFWNYRQWLACVWAEYGSDTKNFSTPRLMGKNQIKQIKECDNELNSLVPLIQQEFHNPLRQRTEFAAMLARFICRSVELFLLVGVSRQSLTETAFQKWDRSKLKP